MLDQELCIVAGREENLNDLLIDLPYKEKNFEMDYQGVKFILNPKNANTFCMEYSSDTYAQNVERVGDTLEGLLDFAYNTGDIINVFNK